MSTHNIHFYGELLFMENWRKLSKNYHLILCLNKSHVWYDWPCSHILGYMFTAFRLLIDPLIPLYSWNHKNMFDPNILSCQFITPDKVHLSSKNYGHFSYFSLKKKQKKKTKKKTNMLWILHQGTSNECPQHNCDEIRKYTTTSL